MARLLLTVLLSGVATFQSAFVSNAAVCTRAEFAQSLSAKYGETPLFSGLSGQGSIFEIYTSPNSWTLLVVPPDDCSWILMVGEAWLPPQPGRDL